MKMNISEAVHEALQRLTAAESTPELVARLILEAAASLPVPMEQPDDAGVQPVAMLCEPSVANTAAAQQDEAQPKRSELCVVDSCDECCAAATKLVMRGASGKRVSAASTADSLHETGAHKAKQIKADRIDARRQDEVDAARKVATNRGFTVPRKSIDSISPEHRATRLSALLLELRAHAADLGEDLDVGDCLALHSLHLDKTASNFVCESPELQRLKSAWQQDSIDEYMATLSMSNDEALYLKDKMMTSYEAWDLMRRMSGANSVWPGANALKMLANEYNAYLADRLGLVQTDKKGYRVDIQKLHEWIVEQQILSGVPAHKIPKKIRYKISLDGSMMGSHEVELVALVPLNLGVAAQSLHAVYPLALYEGKEKRVELEKDLGWISPELRVLEKKQHLAQTGRIHQCEFILCADLFALAKVMRGLDGNGSCPCCAGERSRNQGWDDSALEVWTEVPDEDLPQNLFGLRLRACVVCLLHMKVRVVGTLLKHMAREIEKNKEALDAFEVAMQGMVGTFQLTREKEKKNKKTVKSCYVSAMQGEQCDKILKMVREVGKVMCPQKNGQICENKWLPVMDAMRMQCTAVRLDKWTELWQIFTELYDTLNSSVNVSEDALSRYEVSVARFSDLFSGGNGVSGLKTLKDVTPYVHILVHHSAAYLKLFGSLRDLGQEGFEAAHKRTKQYYAKTNMGGGKQGDPASAHKQVLLKLFRHQYLALKTRSKSKTQKRLNAMDRYVATMSDKHKSRAKTQWRVRKADIAKRYRTRLIRKDRKEQRNKAVKNGRNQLRKWKKANSP
jgi:hypothetical protein